MRKLKIALIVIVQNPKIWVPLILIPIFQLLALWGVCNVDQAVLTKTADYLSIIAGGFAGIMALITEFATKADKEARTKISSAERGDGP